MAKQSSPMELLGQGVSLNVIDEKLGRSRNAVVLKAKRLGLALPQSFKVTKSIATTTTSQEKLSTLMSQAGLLDSLDYLFFFIIPLIILFVKVLRRVREEV